MKYLVSTNLNILHNGKEPTSVISKRKEVLHLTLRTDKIEDLLTLTYLMRSLCQTIDTLNFNFVIWKLPGPNIATPAKPTQNPTRKTLGKSRGFTKSYTLGAKCIAGC
jgi:hypothetical protein